MQYDVFLTAAAADRHTAESLRQTLQNRRINCWLAADDMAVERLAAVFAQSRIAVVLLSRAAMVSQLVTTLTKQILDTHKPCVVALLERAGDISHPLLSHAREYEFNFSLPKELHLDRLADVIASLPELDRSASVTVTGLVKLLDKYPIETVGDLRVSSEQAGNDYDFMRGASPRATDQPLSPRRDRVDCTVFAPSSVSIGDELLVQVLVHRAKDASRRIEEVAQLADGTAQRRGRHNLRAGIRLEDELSFDLTMAPFMVERTRQFIVWDGRTQSAQFRVRVPRTCRRPNVVGAVTIGIGTVPIGEIKFKVQVTGRCGAAVARVSEPLGDVARRYRSAFVSYAWADRREVMDRVQMLDLLGISYFQDLLGLRPGERWEKALYRKIDAADLFLLFWSTAARRSRWVRRETRYAIRRKGGDDLSPPEIKPVIIEGPPAPKPWPELRRLHFNDKFIYFKSGQVA
jgi:hypothetical protein